MHGKNNLLTAVLAESKDVDHSGANTRRIRGGTNGIREESIDEMEVQLAAMQQMLTPIELQRMQHHAHYVVRIPKA